MDRLQRRKLCNLHPIVAAAIRAFTLIWPATCATAAETGAPLAVYGNLPALEDVILSPDGSKVVFVKTDGDERFLAVVRVGARQAMGGARVGTTKLRDIRWMDDDNLLITVSITSAPPFGFYGAVREWYQLLTYNVTERKLLGMNFEVSGTTTFNIVSGDPVVREVEGKTTLFVPGLYVSDRTLPALFKYDVSQRRMKLIARGSEQLTDWLVDSAGRIAAEFVYHDKQKHWELKSLRSDHLLPATSGDASIDMPRVLGFGTAGDSIVVRFLENGDPIWKPLMLHDGTWGSPLDKGSALGWPMTDRMTGRILGGVENSEAPRYVFFDAELQAHWNAILRAFPGEQIDLISHSDDFTKVVVKVFGATDGYVFAMFDWYSHTAQILGSVYKGVVPAEVRRVSYSAADGLTIPGYLTLPRGKAEKNLPLIVMPHGGPAAADALGFDWWAQALAAQGYAVLQPNYRGSSLSYSFLAAGFGEWGRKMQSDLSDGVRYLAAQRLIDPQRVCIVGGSYGGYAALAGVTLDAGVYRCAVSVAGISDLKRLLKWTDNRVGHNDNLSERFWDRFMGASGPNDIALKAISPIEHISNVTAPVLLIHGLDDTVVPFEQSDAMADALKRARKSVELVTLKHEDHWLSRGATRQQMLDATVVFLKANNPPD